MSSSGCLGRKRKTEKLCRRRMLKQEGRTERRKARGKSTGEMRAEEKETSLLELGRNNEREEKEEAVTTRTKRRLGRPRRSVLRKEIFERPKKREEIITDEQKTRISRVVSLCQGSSLAGSRARSLASCRLVLFLFSPSSSLASFELEKIRRC